MLEWNEIEEGAVIEFTNARQGLAAIMPVDAILTFSEHVKIKSNNFVTVEIRHSDMSNTKFELLSKITLPNNYNELKLTAHSDLKNGEEAYFITDEHSWIYVREFKSSNDIRNQFPFYFSDLNRNGILTYSS